ncbi:MAG: mucoidy inhibitor MuiA family protein, partial [Saprospiraceae bacterium]
VYKAKVAQTSGENWDNVRLTLSTADPSIGGAAPYLEPWKLGYYTPTYSNNRISSNSGNRTITGQIIEASSGEPLIGANVTIIGINKGTVSDFDGNFSIDVPAGYEKLEFTYTGYANQTYDLDSRNNIVVALAGGVELDEVVVVGYGLSGRTSGINIGSKKSKSAKAPKIAQTENTTSIEFLIETPYTIKDDGQSRTVQISTYDLTADYQYFSVPKLELAAFLKARIANWESYNLLTGEANLYFEGTYLGRSVIDVENTADTLELSLGRDKNIVVERKKVEEYTDRQFIGKNKTERVGWEISVRNKKNQPIKILIADQVPISVRDDIEVENVKYNRATYNEKTGRLEWNFIINNGATEQVDFQYEVKYPKSRRVRLE